MSDQWPPPGLTMGDDDSGPFRRTSAAEWGEAIETLVVFDMFGIEGVERLQGPWRTA